MSIGRFTRVELPFPRICSAYGCGAESQTMYKLVGGTVLVCQRCAEIAAHR